MFCFPRKRIGLTKYLASCWIIATSWCYFIVWALVVAASATRCCRSDRYKFSLMRVKIAWCFIVIAGSVSLSVALMVDAVHLCMCAVVGSRFVRKDCWEAESLNKRGNGRKKKATPRKRSNESRNLSKMLIKRWSTDSATTATCSHGRWLLGPYWGLSPFWAKSAVKLQVQRSYFKIGSYNLRLRGRRTNQCWRV